jgi:hypothetical protein
MATAVSLTAPNGHKYEQPIGLFINNEFVASKSGEKFATVNPRYASLVMHGSSYILIYALVMKRKSPKFMLPEKRTSISQSRQQERPSRIPHGSFLPQQTEAI